MDEKKKPDLERTQELFEFLKGHIPEGYKISRKHRPKLTSDQAWTIIWYLGNQYWQVTDHVERCDICGELFDSNIEGACLDYGRAPYEFCESCMSSQAYAEKDARNPEGKNRQ